MATSLKEYRIYRGDLRWACVEVMQVRISVVIHKTTENKILVEYNRPPHKDHAVKQCLKTFSRPQSSTDKRAVVTPKK